MTRKAHKPELRCPHCGQRIEIWVDEGGLDRQSYVEDCSVCCRPLLVSVQIDRESGEHWIALDGDP